ncbi:MAG: aminotransferase [Bradymonadia bacterium]|jgi:aminotransferase
MKTRSDRINGLVQSEIRAMTRACDAVGGVNLGQGICDTPTPTIVEEAASEAIATHRSTYTRFDGTAELREALAAKFRRDNNMAPDAETEVVVTVGSSGALACTLNALCDPGDELLLFEPFYGYHMNTALVAGMVPKPIPLHPPSFTLDTDAIEQSITPRTRAILINTPVNPSGKVFSREELVRLSALCIKHDLLCITDEVYEYLIYGDHEHVSMGSLPGMWERTVTLGSYSKTFSITGWRIGYATAAAPLAAAIGLMNDLYYICSPHPLQLAVAKGIRELPASFYTDMRDEYLAKRDDFCSVLTEVGLPPVVPDGAYYVLADVSRLGEATAKDAAMRLLHESGVASVAGSAFFVGPEGEKYVRFCYAKRDEPLNRAMNQLRAWGKRR